MSPPNYTLIVNNVVFAGDEVTCLAELSFFEG